MQNASTVFHFEDPIEFLNSHFRERQKKNPKFSLRAWARQIGYQNPSLLFQVLRGERRLKMELALRLAANLQLKGKSLRYFELIVLNRTCQSEAERRVYETMLQKLRPKKIQVVTKVSLELVAAASEWYHWAIMSMVELADFEPNVNWIHERLNGEIDKRTIKQAFERLVKLGFLVKRDNGKYEIGAEDDSPYYMAGEIPSHAIRQLHMQMIEKARVAVEQQTVDERVLNSSTLAFRREDLPAAKEILAEAHRQILALAGASKGKGEDVYQLNMQFFRLTKKKVERTH